MGDRTIVLSAAEVWQTVASLFFGLQMSDSLEESSLLYHSIAPAGKLSVTPTKPLANQIDLAQAYSPGVAFPCLRIEKDPLAAALYTARSNLVGVITNGSAVLGLGNIGPLAANR